MASYVKTDQMAPYERSYETARTVFSLLEIVGWIVVGIGVIVASFAFRALSDASGGVGFILGITSAGGMVISGLISVAFVQSSLANVDTAEMTRDLLNIAKSYSHPGKVDLPSASNDSEEKTTQPDKSYRAQQPVPDLTNTYPNKRGKRLIETFMGIKIYQKYDGYYIKDKWFANLAAAKAFVKKALNEEVKSKTQNDEDQ